ncbi:MAG: PQQ-binding-like beta-propeller repeat protein [Planctomycetaceae bacterium]|nr:PQQ-binding-like beta-propeller repeat protein [Planctomycetaceae bacterium]
MNTIQQKRRLLCLSLVTGCLLAGPLHADDWLEWRGKDRLAVWHEQGIMQKFPEDGLKVSWRRPIGSGYSGPVVADGKVITMDYRPKPETEIAEAIERVICFDEETGETLWTNDWETHYREVMGSYRTGPRATPTIDGDRVYTLGSVGHIRCLDINSGELIWSKDSRKEYGLLLPVFGTSTAPIVDGDLVIFATGGKNSDQVRAFNKMTGEEVWSALPANYELGYSQFVIYEHAGTRQLIYWDPQFLRSLNPQTGEVYWEIPIQVNSGMSIATPVKSGSKMLVSSFYSGSVLVELADDQPTAKKLWEVHGAGERPQQTDGLHAMITTPIIQGDYFYGTCSYGEFRGLDLKTGERLWVNDKLTRQGRWGSAFLVANGDRYFMMNDEGELLIVKFSPEGPEEIDRTKLITPDTESGYGVRRYANSIVNWCHPAFANKHVIVRNDHEILRMSLAE